MLNCTKARKLMKASISGRALSPGEAEQIQEHLAHCPGCAELEAWNRAMGQGFEQIKQSALPQAGEDFNRRLWQRLEQPAPRERFRLQWIPSLGFALGIAAAAAAVIYISERTWHAVPVPASQVSRAETPEPVHPLAAQQVKPGISQAPPNASAPEAAPRLAPQTHPPAPRVARESVQPADERSPMAARPESLAPMPSLDHPAANQRPKESSVPRVIVSASDSKSTASFKTSGVHAPQAAQSPLAGEARLLRNKINLNQGERTYLEFVLERPSRISVKIYSREGKLVRNWFDGSLSAGPQILEWDGILENGQKAASGIYLVVLGGEFPEHKFKLAVIK